MAFRLLTLLMGLLAASAVLATNETIRSVAYGAHGGTQFYSVIEPDSAPRGVGVFFIGGDGNLRLATKATVGGVNVLVRLKDDLLRGAQLRLIYVDAPDVQGTVRYDQAAADAVYRIVDAENKERLPVLVFGISRGTISAMNVAARDAANRITGLVLLSTVQRPTYDGTVYDAPVDQVRSHVLVVQHANDACASSSGGMRTIDALAQRMPNSRSVKGLVIEGGYDAAPGAGRAADCHPQSHHGFMGADRTLSAAIVEWITATIAPGGLNP
jgi:pimeloyl-ACP methyl ester carboxylesterase